ncbi:MAG: NAD(P) transhydrogenase subunit alpha [Planctomycetes bacterium]|nr:NAD(P) transhydrogenase subunit alpha [Planctomycetota bacterium]
MPLLAALQGALPEALGSALPSLATALPLALPAAAEGGHSLQLLTQLTIFVLAVFLGIEVINKVPPTLHTPLMSGSNAISGITIVGAILSATTGEVTVANVLGAIAIAAAMINVVGGFLVTDRMLRFFKKR